MSKYGYFDDKNCEYVITNPNTPQPWTNYSGDRKYGAVYSNNAAGYSFTRSAATGRLLRFSYVSPMASQPGRYFYLRDAADGDFWSAGWLPVAKPLDKFEYECRMGTAYMTITSRYRDIVAEATYFVPLGQEFEYWVLKITNTGQTARNLDVFSYAEFTSVWDIMHDEFNQQYANAISLCKLQDGMAAGGNMVNLPFDPNFGERHQSRWWYMMQAGELEVKGYDFERESFLGSNGSYSNPQAVISGTCSNSEAYGDTSCVAFQSGINLAPGENKELIILMGAGKAEKVGVKIRQEFGSSEAAAAEFAKLKSYWHGRLGKIIVDSPDPAFNSMVNVWNAYNALMTFEWSRTCSLVYNGIDRDGFGFRDTVQDILGVLPSIPKEAKERLKLMLSGQESLGGAQPVVDPVFFKAGKMPKVDPGIQRADDCLWFFNTVPAYVNETGDVDFYREVVSFADAGAGTVFEHLRKALEFNLAHLGKNGLACGLIADWNDCIKLGANGESIFVSLQLRLGLKVYAEIAEFLGEKAEAEWAEKNLADLDAAIQKYTWDGEWFIRAIPEDGSVFGSKNCEEGQIFLNPQSWSVISGAATDEQAEKAMESVDKLLASDYGCMLHSSSYRKISREIMHAVVYLPGVKENGSIFQHPQGWAVIADCILGQGDRAYRHFRSYLPAAQNEQADIRQTEPYVYAQWTHAPESPFYGRSRVPWLSGTATWSYFAATQYILGIRPELNGLRIDPCIPATWKNLSVKRIFRGKNLNITIKNPHGKEKGISKLILDGKETINGSLLPLEKISDGMNIEAVMCG